MSAGNQSYDIKTAVFEGPLELLIELVERRKLLINDISLAKVTDEYMSKVASLQNQSVAGTAQFVALAATLLLIKSKSLLPIIELTDEEEEAVGNLEERLKQYQIYRNAGEYLANVYGEVILHEKQFFADTRPLFTPDKYTSPTSLLEAMQQVLEDLPVESKTPKAQVRNSITIEEVMDSLKKRIEESFELRFSELVTAETEKVDVIVSFLAVLESVKQGTVLVAQERIYADIEIKKSRTSTPSYQ